MSPDDISLEFSSYNNFDEQNPVGKAKRQILYAGVFAINLAGSNLADNQKEVFHPD